MIYIKPINYYVYDMDLLAVGSWGNNSYRKERLALNEMDKGRKWISDETLSVPKQNARAYVCIWTSRSLSNIAWQTRKLSTSQQNNSPANLDWDWDWILIDLTWPNLTHLHYFNCLYINRKAKSINFHWKEKFSFNATHVQALISLCSTTDMLVVLFSVFNKKLSLLILFKIIFN